MAAPALYRQKKVAPVPAPDTKIFHWSSENFSNNKNHFGSFAISLLQFLRRFSYFGICAEHRSVGIFGYL